jgi:hypothetical protein
MAEIRINHKEYKNLEKLPISKLEHIRQLAQDAVTNYKPFTLTAPMRRRLLVEGTMKRLNGYVKILDDLIQQKKEEVPFPKDS